jgi:hypothetical protein
MRRGNTVEQWENLSLTIIKYEEETLHAEEKPLIDDMVESVKY